MKTVSKFLVLAVVILSLGGAFKPVEAACGADQNIYQRGYKDVNEQVAKQYDEDQPVSNLAHTGADFAMTNSNQAVGFLFNEFGKYVGCTLSEYMEKDMSPGTVQMASDGMYQAMLNGPSENIGGYYANMLLPKEVTQSTAYAMDCGERGFFGTAPSCEGTFGIWTSFGIATLWGASFSIAMIMVVIVLIISGFMVMFRTRISGQLVVSVSMALQNVVLASIMSLASFALGAFFVNLSKALILIIANLFIMVVWSNLGSDNFILKLINTQIGTFAITNINDPFGLFAKAVVVLLAGDVASFAANAATTLKSAGGILGTTFGLGDGPSVLAGLATVAGKLVVFTGTNIANIPMYMLVRAITGVVLLAASIRIWWAAVKIYIIMVIDVIMAPIVFVFSSIPGKSTAVKDWLLKMFRNSITVPIMFAAVNATMFVIIKTAINNGASGGAFVGADPTAAISGGALPTNIGGFLVNMISPQAIVAMVLFNMIPGIPAVVADMFSGKPGQGLDKLNEATMKQLQKIPLAGSLFS